MDGDYSSLDGPMDVDEPDKLWGMDSLSMDYVMEDVSSSEDMRSPSPLPCRAGVPSILPQRSLYPIPPKGRFVSPPSVGHLASLSPGLHYLMVGLFLILRPVPVVHVRGPCPPRSRSPSPVAGSTLSCPFPTPSIPSAYDTLSAPSVSSALAIANIGTAGQHLRPASSFLRDDSPPMPSRVGSYILPAKLGHYFSLQQGRSKQKLK
ncbi:hypothetical protein INT44_004045 [Umbelopsis vinacea]|uniref:Uncharacterized protein n=1 Tax=Umbelopsis vinacea TaxID=44442 RepID=A0A8H7QB75_9FUNG|nr:hypothetical protein INT44_004045 [Umbelopsis vinacea]